MKLEASVVVPAYNRPELLEMAIRALASQSIGEKNFEVILVHGNSAEVERACIAAGKKFRNFHCIASESESPSRKRNIGIMHAKGEIIAFTDDDCIPDNDWLAEIVEAFAENLGAAGIEGLTYTKGGKILYSNAPVNLSGGLFPTCNMAFRKKAIKKTGGFDEAYHFYREDSDLAFRAMEFGEIKFCPEARVLHPQRRVPLLRPLETIFLLKGDVRLMKKQPQKYWKYLGKFFAADAAKSLASILVFAATIAGIFTNIAFAAAAAAAYLCFSLFMARRTKFSATEFFAFSLFGFLRGLLFPFFLAYYWLVVR